MRIFMMQATVFRDDSYSCLVLVREDLVAILETRKALKLCASAERTMCSSL